MTSSDPLLGQTLGSYRLERLLGRGGMGQVYLARDLHLGRVVAIKVIESRLRENTAYHERFAREARSIAAWSHPNIIQIYEAGEQDGLSYFVMEYLQGDTLRDLLNRYAAQGALLPHDEIIRIGLSLAHALDYAHHRGVIHRDIKPANILLAGGRVVLMDFGLALDASLGSQGEVLGSAHYIAPEQARRSSEAVPQSDLYSLGIILYQMLTGSLPFDDPSPTSLAVQHLILPPPSPRAINPAINARTEAVLLKALSKDPALRYASGEALMSALADAIQRPAEVVELPPLPPEAGELAAAPADPLIGRQIYEFVLERMLGRGGMARVYLGRDTRLNRSVAIKIIDPSYQADDSYAHRFEREAQTIARLEHPNIVRLYRYGEADGLLFIAMQYVEGEDLRTRLQRGALPPQEILRITRDLCAALDYLHVSGVIHRDLTPANVILDETGRAILTDFGLALLTEQGTAGEIFGSPYYIAPEQAISSAKAVPQSDIYALGVILYQMFTGQVPFDSPQPMEVALLHMIQTPVPPSQVHPGISPEVDSLILRAMAKDPKDRPANGAALARELALALGEPDGMTLSAASSRTLPVPPKPDPAAPPSPLSALRRLPPRALYALLVVCLLASSLIVRQVLTSAQFFVAGYLPLLTASPGPALSPTAWLRSSATPSPATATPSAVHTSTRPISTRVSPSATLPSPTALATPEAAATVAPPPPASPLPTSTPSATTNPLETPTITRTPLSLALRRVDQMPMVLIPAGAFVMGAMDRDTLAETDERPAHLVKLEAFAMDQHEVTVAQYVAFLNLIGKHAPDACQGFTCVLTKSELFESHILWAGGSVYWVEDGYDNWPVNNVTWYGAETYCERMGARLPTEAEWEYAASGYKIERALKRIYPWGDEKPNPGRAIFAADFNALQSVDALPEGASFFGVLGMAGGVWEWVADAYDEIYYAIGPIENPLGPRSGMRTPRVLRGGSWASPDYDLRLTNRRSSDPLAFKEIGNDAGFRCVQSTP